MREQQTPRRRVGVLRMAIGVGCRNRVRFIIIEVRQLWLTRCVTYGGAGVVPHTNLAREHGDKKILFIYLRYKTIYITCT